MGIKSVKKRCVFKSYLSKLHTAFVLFWRRLFSKERKELSSFELAEKISTFIYPKYRFSEFGRIWLDDKDFFNYYEKYDKTNYHSADRKYFLRSLLELIVHLPGDTAECGVYKGASSELICK